MRNYRELTTTSAGNHSTCGSNCEIIVRMTGTNSVSRRKFLREAWWSAAAAASPRLAFLAFGGAADGAVPLEEFGYGDVTLASQRHERQLRESQAVLMELDEDSILKPLRQM